MEQRRLHFPTEPERSRAVRRPSYKWSHLPARSPEVRDECSAEVASCAADGDDAPFISRGTQGHAASQPMRWALAMTDSVIVVAGTLGSTVASTACNRRHPDGR